MEISQEKRKTGHTLATLCLLLSTGECVEWALINLVATLTSIYESSDVTCAAARSFMKKACAMCRMWVCMGYLDCTKRSYYCHCTHSCLQLQILQLLLMFSILNYEIAVLYLST